LARSLTAFQELDDTFITRRAKIANELEIISVLLQYVFRFTLAHLKIGGHM
jgi:hypothetical protein